MSEAVRFGLAVLDYQTADETPALTALVDLAQRAEAIGFDSIWLGDHLEHLIGGPMLEPYVLLGALAGATSTLRLGVLVTPVTFRPPAIVAKLASTLDVISGGRAILGLGAGASGMEHQHYGIPLPPLGDRLELLEETVEICRRLFDGSRVTYSGRQIRLEDAYLDPVPIQGVGLPILIGGKSKRVLQIAARQADLANFTYVSPTRAAELVSQLATASLENGRPTAIATTWMGGVVIGATASEIESRGLAFRKRRGMAADVFDSVVPHGNVSHVGEHLSTLIDAGIREFYLGVSASISPSDLELLGTAVTLAVASDT